MEAKWPDACNSYLLPATHDLYVFLSKDNKDGLESEARREGAQWIINS